MKKFCIFILYLGFSAVSISQITLLNTYTKQIYLTKLNISGYKFVEVNLTTSLITVYNTNNSVFATMTLQPQPYPIQAVCYISETLFDTDPGLEYCVTTYTGPPVYNIFKIYNDNGSLLFTRDSASLYQTNSVSTYELFRQDGIFNDGVSTKMRLQVGNAATTRFELYDLPGSITCLNCNNGTVTAIRPNQQQGGGVTENIVFPNPASDYVKIKYQLPEKAKKSVIKVFDSTGKLQEELKITSTFDCIYLSKSYANGLYYFQLVVDDQIIKTEKIVVEK